MLLENISISGYYRGKKTDGTRMETESRRLLWVQTKNDPTLKNINGGKG
jgi:hypothetical protein